MSFQNYLLFVLLIEASSTALSFSDDVLPGVASKIGYRLWELGTNLTRHFELKVDFSHSNVTELDPSSAINEMKKRIHSMLERKKSALNRIVYEMEECTRTLPDAPTAAEKESFNFRDARNLSQEDRDKLSKDVNFFNYHVAVNFSTVHVPTDVYYKNNETLLGIKCSEVLDGTFQHNYATDSTLSWQYFAGASGFTRIYPGFEWTPLPEQDAVSVLFDSRSRPWYTEAASDPKDLVILIDNSGSMMGQKMKIARHTINMILETLGPNDFVSIYEFNDEAKVVLPCFESHLVQANLATVRELKYGVEKMSKANNVANFTLALIKAFEVLDFHRQESLAAMCNQAIMLITDGVHAKYKEIFEKFNWKNATEPPFPVRVFTYLIGRTGADFRDTQWMACANQGYYVQLNTIPEVKEEVFKYINVLARPLVLKKPNKSAWTPLYVHRVDPKVTDYKWEVQQNEQQKQYTISYRDDWKAFLRTSAQLKRAESWKKVMMDQTKNIEDENFQFMVSVSHPAYDRRERKNITEHILINEAYWTERVYETDVASLLGVAGTDIPISEFKRIIKSYYLGVDNYGFIVNNNGHLIMHPDLRPFFRGTLKPGFNNVDLLEVELLDTGDGHRDPRDFDIEEHYVNGEQRIQLSNLSLLRDLIINETDTTDSNYFSFQIKYHYDQMKRVHTGERNYFTKRIEDSPFTLVLTVMSPPCNNSHCQAARILAPNPERKIIVGLEKANELFSGLWNIHPDWFYCKLNYNNELYKGYAGEELSKKTSELMYFLKKMVDSSFWEQSKDPYVELPDDLRQMHDERKNINDRKLNMNEKSSSKVTSIPILSYYCDQELIRNLLFDANVTKNIFRHLENGFSVSPEFNFSEESILNVFISTHSGLTRWKDLSKHNTSFGFVNSKSIDEVWYKRAVHEYYRNKESFVFSIPFEQQTIEDLIVTASHAIFIRGRKKRSDELQAPIAVVGFQLLYAHFAEYIKNVVENAYKSSSETTSYLVIDDNAYVISSFNAAHIGQFLGALYPDIMRALRECHIFRRIVVYDYQGVCFPKVNSNGATIYTLTNPLKLLSKLITWTVGTFFVGIVQIYIELLITILTTRINFAEIIVTDEEEFDDEISIENVDEIIKAGDPPKYRRVKHIVMLNRTRPQTCDRKIVLYQLEPEKNWERKYNCSSVVKFKPIPHTNLLLVILSNTTQETRAKHTDTEPVQVRSPRYASQVCYRATAVLSRRRISSCAAHHKEEKKITLCGSGSSLAFSFTALLALCLQYLHITL